MRILLVTANYRPSVGGIERFVELLAGGLAERGHEVTVATCKTRGAPKTEQYGSIRIVRIPSTDAPRERLGVPYPIPAPRACFRTMRTLVRQADIVHAQDALYLTSVAALARARSQGVPSVLTQHVGFVPQRNAALDLVQHAAFLTLGRTARLADAVVAYNPGVADWARRTWRLGEVRLLPIGVPTLAASATERAEVRGELSLREDTFVALFAGRDVPKKRLDVFLAASDPAYELIAVTDRRSAGSPGVRILPFTSPERFGRLLTAMDAFVLPSEAEGFPLALQEALVAGLPCVVAHEPNYERFLRQDEVLFVQPEATALRDALLELSANREYRQALGARGAAAGRREFHLDRFVDAYEALYNELVTSGRALNRRDRAQESAGNRE